jgi:cell division protein FtsL
MAACATDYYDVSRGLSARIAARNAELMAQQPKRRRGARTPEFFFPRGYDNSRLVKAPDPARVREMRLFSGAIAILFLFVMVYGLQHFSAIESGYRVEAEKQVRDQLREENRQLRLSEAQLTQPDRIDKIAREQGLTDPQPGQVIHPTATGDSSAPALAQASVPTSQVGQ